MLTVSIIGASGYTGAQLVELVLAHPGLSLHSAFVSSGSADAGKAISTLHGKLAGQCDTLLQPIDAAVLPQLADSVDAIFLATPHEASHEWLPLMIGHRARIFDLSGAFRLADQALFERHYGFAHTADEVLAQAVYGLAEWREQDIRETQIVAVPGCYPTASLLALKPLQHAELLDPNVRPVINAVSGVSGAGRKATLGNSFCEVSLQAYGVLNHRHTPEIESHLGTSVIFTPHLGNFKRGILATVTAKLNAGVSAQDLSSVMHQAYAKSPIVRLRQQWPKLDDVVNTPFCDLHWSLDETSQYAVITSAIDNVMKGAASQAIQCLNITQGWASEFGLIPGAAK